jgi:outer membrane protein OmpA-like peptidoglycan-associated protein
VIGRRTSSQRRGRDEAEKPFWISYADLMTALMVLFLVVMAVALLAVTRTVTDRERREAEYKADIDDCMTIAVEAAQRHQGVVVSPERKVIDFGDRARFEDKSSLLSQQQEGVLRRFVPELLTMIDHSTCKRVLKRIVVEGHTSRTGTYLANLNLSLMRSQRVLCAMFKESGDDLLTEIQKIRVRDYFFVGGFAFNSYKNSDEESRRVEMRIEFWGIDDDRTSNPASQTSGLGTCAI